MNPIDFPREKRSNLTSNILQLQVNKFVSNRNNQIIMPSTPINAILNTNGFLEILNGAIKCTGTEILESIIPKEGDLSIKQNNGFSFFLWIYLSKFSPKKEINEETTNIYYIFRKGSSIDEFTPELGIIPNPDKHFLINLATSTQKKVTILSNKIIEENHLYSFGISFDFGKVDISNKSFRGVIADLMMTPNVLNEQEIFLVHNEGLKNLYKSNGEKLNMNLVFNEIFKKKRLINKYAFYTGKTVFEVENLGLTNEKMIEIVKNYDEEEKINDIRPIPIKKNIKYEKMIEEMTFFLGNEDQRILCNKIDMNSNLIHTCLYLANQGEDNLEIERVLNIFNTLEEILLFNLSEDFIIKLAKILNAYLESNESSKVQKYIITNKFFENLHTSLDVFETKEKNEEIENEKYSKKNKKNKKENLNYLLRRNYNEKNEPLPPKKTKGFGNCIPEHEKLLLSKGTSGNYVEEKGDENLKNFNSMVRIKDLYDIPKNLPGEDNEIPNVQIIQSESESKILTNLNNELISNDNTTNLKNTNLNNKSDFNDTSRTNTSKKIKKIKLNDKTIEEKNYIHNLLLDLLEEKPDKVKTPEIGLKHQKLVLIRILL